MRHQKDIQCPITFIRTSPVFGEATSTVSRVKGFFASQATAARHVIVCKIITNATLDINVTTHLAVNKKLIKW